MNVFYSLIKMKATFFNIVIYLICCRCLVLHSVSAENSPVSSSTQTSHFNKIETDIKWSTTTKASIHNSSFAKIIHVNQTLAEQNNTIHNTNQSAEITLSTNSEVFQGTTSPFMKSTTTNNTEKVTKIPEKGQSTKTVAPTERIEIKFSTASSPPSDGEGKPSSNGRKGGFDGPSFIGGIILALGLIGFGYIAYKFCSKRTNINYRNV